LYGIIALIHFRSLRSRRLRLGPGLRPRTLPHARVHHEQGVWRRLVVVGPVAITALAGTAARAGCAGRRWRPLPAGAGSGEPSRPGAQPPVPRRQRLGSGGARRLRTQCADRCVAGLRNGFSTPGLSALPEPLVLGGQSMDQLADWCQSADRALELASRVVSDLASRSISLGSRARLRLAKPSRPPTSFKRWRPRRGRHRRSLRPQT
jgi:hypothetical protein